MSQKNKTTYWLVFGMAILAGISALAWILYGKIEEISGIIKNADAQIQFLEAKESEFSKIASEITKSKDQIEKIEAVFLKEETFVNFVELLESMSKEAGTKIKAESAKLPDSKEPANVVFSLEGNFSQIMKFLALLDHMPVAGIVNNIEITAREVKSEEKISQGTLLAKVNYTIFSFEQK